MQMTTEEIFISWREAKDPKAQINVLADLNGCKPQKIQDIIDGYKKEHPTALPPVAELAKQKKPRGNNARLTDDEKAKIAEMYLSGMSFHKISISIGRSECAVKTYIRNSGLEKQREAANKRGSVKKDKLTQPAAECKVSPMKENRSDDVPINAEKPDTATIASTLMDLLRTELAEYIINIEYSKGVYEIDVEIRDESTTFRKKVHG